MKISVIIPTYKPQSYLWDCLDSMVAQTLPKEVFELILVLNGCSEPWKSQIQEYLDSKMKSMNVKFIHTEQGGVSNARNMALDVAEGEYVTFIDDDDYISPTYLEEMLALASSDTMVLAKPIAFWDETREVKKYRITQEYIKCAPKGRQQASKARRYFSGPCMKLIPMNFIQERRYDVRFRNGEDSLFMFLISDKFKDVVFTSENAIYYRRIRERSATTGYRSRKNIILNGLNMMRALSAIYISDPLHYSFSFYLTRIMASMHSIIHDCMNVARK